MNSATLAIGIVVAAVLVIAAYFTYRTFRSGGCENCKNCCKKDDCHPDTKSKNK